MLDDKDHIPSVTVTDENCTTYEYQCQQKEEMEKQHAERQLIIETQKGIMETLEAFNGTVLTLNGTITRMFDLYEEHDKEIKEMKIYMIKTDAVKDKLDKDVEERKKAIKDIVENKLPEHDHRITTIENSKADKADITEVLLEIQKVGSTLDNHCAQDIKVETDAEETKRLKLDRKDKYIIAVLGIITGVAIFVAGYIWVR